MQYIRLINDYLKQGYHFPGFFSSLGIQGRWGFVFLILREFWGSEIAAKEILVQVHTYALNDSNKWTRFSDQVLTLTLIKGFGDINSKTNLVLHFMSFALKSIRANYVHCSLVSNQINIHKAPFLSCDKKTSKKDQHYCKNSLYILKECFRSLLVDFLSIMF